jgi:hypothetical protein
VTANGSVTGTNDVGGIVGTMQNGSVLDNVGFLSTVSGTLDVGGIVGLLSAGTINQVYDNVADGITGNTNVGGLVGAIMSGATLNNGLFGGEITGVSTVGGIVGLNQGTVNNVLSVGTIAAGATITGAMAGDNQGSILNSFYDTRMIPNAVGAGTSEGSGYDTNAILEGPSLYTSAGWDFVSIWSTSTGNYPVLQFCTTDCAVPLPHENPPTPTPSNKVIQQQIAGIRQAISINETTNMLDPLAMSAGEKAPVQDALFSKDQMSIDIMNNALQVLVYIMHLEPNQQNMSPQEKSQYEANNQVNIAAALEKYYSKALRAGGKHKTIAGLKLKKDQAPDPKSFKL